MHGAPVSIRGCGFRCSGCGTPPGSARRAAPHTVAGSPARPQLFIPRSGPVSSRVSACSFAAAGLFAGHSELATWLCLSPRRCRVRASGWPGSRTGRSPAGVAGAGGVLDAGAREPMIEACGERRLTGTLRAPPDAERGPHRRHVQPGAGPVHDGAEDPVHPARHRDTARRICRRAQERPADGCGTADSRRFASRRWTGTAGPSPKVCLEQPGTGQRILQTLIRAGTRRPSTGTSARLQ
jgi:hypothetical protein